MHRRQLLLGAPAGVAGLAALSGLLGAGIASADPAADVGSRSTPAGTWEFAIQVSNGQPVEHSMYALTGDGIVVHVSNNGLIGLGTWRRANAGFVIGFREWLTDNAGQVEGSIHVRLDCAYTGEGVRANGVAVGFDLGGNKIFEGTSTGTGSRFGIEV
jgi:hypothetical protein